MTVTPIVYLFWNQNEDLLYVGQTRDPDRRFYEHEREKPWREVARIDMIHLDSREAAMAAERNLIRMLGPRWNHVHHLGESGLCRCDEPQPSRRQFEVCACCGDVGWVADACGQIVP